MRRRRSAMPLDRLRDRALEGRSEHAFRDEYERLGAEIARRRADLRLSQRELAELWGTTQSAVARLEAGRRAARLDTLLRVANALDCELVVRLRPRTTGGGQDEN
jgi:transcriptional regulator with XRE-family HTH domain